MTYRNDHEAALARIETLEQENARLERENAALRAPAAPTEDDDEDEPRAPGAVPKVMTGLILGTVIAIVALVASAIRDTPPTTRSDDVRVTMPDAQTTGYSTNGERP